MILRLLLLYLYYFIPWETVRDTGELVAGSLSTHCVGELGSTYCG